MPTHSSSIVSVVPPSVAQPVEPGFIPTVRHKSWKYNDGIYIMVNNSAHDKSPAARSLRGGSRRRFLAAIGGVGVTTFAGCIGNIGGGGGSDNTVRYGVLSPMTGAYSSLGPEQRRGAKLGIKTVNESDAFDFEIKATYKDTGTSATTARRAAEQAVKQFGASYLMGAISSSVGLALNAFAESNEVIYNPGAAALPITGTSCNPYVFRAETNTAQIAEAIGAYSVKNLGRKVWFHIADYAYGESVLNLVRSEMQAAAPGLEVVGVSRSQLGANNFDPFITEISNSAAEVCIIGMTGGDLITFVNQAASQGLKKDVEMVSPTMTFAVVRKALGMTAAGTYGGVRYLSTLETGDNQAFVDAYKKKYGAPPDNFARVGYQSILMTAHGIRKAGSTDPTTVKDTLAGLQMPTIYGTNQFRECNHQALNPTWMGKLVPSKNGDVPDVKLLKKINGKDAVLSCAETECKI